MASMNVTVSFLMEGPADPALEPYVLYREHVRPVLEDRRGLLDAMYAPVIGRPETDPVLLAGVTLLQYMERLPDRQAVERCRFDARWRMALRLDERWDGLDASTLCVFRARLAEHAQGRLVLDAGIEAMRRAGYLGKRRAIRSDSTHVLGKLAKLSRLECVRETLRIGLRFLSAWGGPEAWDPWFSRYAEQNPKHLRRASAAHLQTTMTQAGEDLHAILARAQELGRTVQDSEPVRLLQRVFEEQFDRGANGCVAQRRATPSGAIHNPHEPEAQWSTKHSKEWVGYKLQVAETAPEQVRARGEPTEAVITAMVVQPAIASDQTSIEPVLAVQTNTLQEMPETVFADAGYVNAPALERAQTAGYELCGPAAAPPNSSKQLGSDTFAVDLPSRTAICPNGKRSCGCIRIAESGRQAVYFFFTWSLSDCSVCPLAKDCLSKRSAQPRRTLQVGEKHMLIQARRQLCRTPEYQLRMQRRNGIEGTQSECVRGYGARRCRYRGLARTGVQMQFIGAACNLRRWANRRCWLDRNG